MDFVYYNGHIVSQNANFHLTVQNMSKDFLPAVLLLETYKSYFIILYNFLVTIDNNLIFAHFNYLLLYGKNNFLEKSYDYRYDNFTTITISNKSLHVLTTFIVSCSP